jgi:hypothetical protein
VADDRWYGRLKLRCHFDCSDGRLGRGVWRGFAPIAGTPRIENGKGFSIDRADWGRKHRDRAACPLSEEHKTQLRLPLRDGTSGGQFISATLPDGTKFGAGAGQVAQPEPAQNN